MDSGAWPAWFLGGCVLIAFVCASAGVVAVVRAAMAVRRRTQTVVPETLIAKANAARDAADRLSGMLVLAEAVLARITRALDRMSASSRELRHVLRPKG